MRCFRIELVRYIEGEANVRQVWYEADDVAADTTYRNCADALEVKGETMRGVFIDVLEVNTDEDLAKALQDPQGSRYDQAGLTLVARSAGAF